MTERRRFLVTAGGALTAAAATAIVDAPRAIAQPKVQWRMTTTWTSSLDILQGAAQRLGQPVADLSVADGVVSPKGGGAGVSYGALVGDRQLGLAMDAKVPLKASRAFRYIGQSVPRPDVPAKVTGRHLYVQNLTLPGMLHGRAIRPPALGAALQSVDESSIAAIPGARVVRIGGFLGVVAEREWDAVRAARALRAQWSAGTGLPDHLTLAAAVRATRIVRDQDVAKQGDLSALAAPGPGVQTLGATYWWPVQTHGALGPSCGVADVRPDGATIWTPSQATHRYRAGFARILGLPRDKVRLIYMDGAGSYGQNGAEDAACDAALLSRAVGRPVRVQAKPMPAQRNSGARTVAISVSTERKAPQRYGGRRNVTRRSGLL